MCLKEYLLNYSAFHLGVPGNGKSFSAKMELVIIALMFPDDDILVCDPENEYSALIKALGGEVIRIAAGSDDHINFLDEFHVVFENEYSGTFFNSAWRRRFNNKTRAEGELRLVHRYYME